MVLSDPGQRGTQTGVTDLGVLFLGPVLLIRGGPIRVDSQTNSGDGYAEQGCQAWLMSPTP